MKTNTCPQCDKKVEFDVIKKLVHKRAILCPYCGNGIRVNQSFMTKTMIAFGVIAGIIGTDIYKLSILDTTAVMFFFSLVYSFLHLHFIGLFLPLEAAEDDDLMI